MCACLSVVRIFFFHSFLPKCTFTFHLEKHREHLFSVMLVAAFMKNLLVVFCYILACFDCNPQQCSVLEHLSNMRIGPGNVTTFKLIIYQFMNRISRYVCGNEKLNSNILKQFSLMLPISLGIFIIAFRRKSTKVNASAIFFQE